MQDHQLTEFWEMSPSQRQSVLLEAIQETHAWHYPRNPAYQRTVSARGVGPEISAEQLPGLIRPTSQTFKSYIDILGTPFPQDQPRTFLDWLADQLSIELPRQRFDRLRPGYKSLEALLREIEGIFSDFGFEISTSSGTSGRATIMVRDREGIEKTVESLYLSFQRYMGMQADHRMIIIMPKDTRIAMARFTGSCLNRLGMTQNNMAHFTIPFPAYPDQVRIRAGRTFQSGWRGVMERRFLHPFMNWAYEHYAMPKTIRQTISLLEKAETAGEKVVLFGGWIQLHTIAQEIQTRGRVVRLPPGSLLGTGGGFKEHYPFTPEQIHQDLSQAILSTEDQPLPFHDVYGMAEGNWAAMQCSSGSYHIPPWVYALTMDEHDRFQQEPDSTGMLAFFDPYGGGRLFPAFFKSADQVRLINSTGHNGAADTCPCGESGTYITQGSIQRVDLLDEAGCAAQI